METDRTEVGGPQPVAWRIDKFMFVFGEDYEPELAYLEKILAPGKTFIDVGAAFGIYFLVAVHRPQEGRLDS